jgi:hypothetical protein
MGQEFIKFLKEAGVLEELISYLYDYKPVKSNNKKVVPLKWIEARIQNIRKLATETNKSINSEKLQMHA